MESYGSFQSLGLVSNVIVIKLSFGIDEFQKFERLGQHYPMEPEASITPMMIKSLILTFVGSNVLRVSLRNGILATTNSY